jgi:hypothetical protein
MTKTAGRCSESIMKAEIEDIWKRQIIEKNRNLSLGDPGS